MLNYQRVPTNGPHVLVSWASLLGCLGKHRRSTIECRPRCCHSRRYADRPWSRSSLPRTNLDPQIGRTARRIWEEGPCKKVKATWEHYFGTPVQTGLKHVKASSTRASQINLRLVVAPVHPAFTKLPSNRSPKPATCSGPATDSAAMGSNDK